MTSIAIKALPAPFPLLDDTSEFRTIVVDEPDAYPCRRCLTDALPGERVRLLSYDPFTGDSPYRHPGPIFVHDSECERDDDAVPAQLTRRQLSLRSFDAQHLMRSGEVVEGTLLLERATQLLVDPDIAYIHVHNAGPGCFAARVDRRSST